MTLSRGLSSSRSINAAHHGKLGVLEVFYEYEFAHIPGG